MFVYGLEIVVAIFRCAVGCSLACSRVKWLPWNVTKGVSAHIWVGFVSKSATSWTRGHRGCIGMYTNKSINVHVNVCTMVVHSSPCMFQLLRNTDKTLRNYKYTYISLSDSTHPTASLVCPGLVCRGNQESLNLQCLCDQVSEKDWRGDAGFAITKKMERSTCSPKNPSWRAQAKNMLNRNVHLPFLRPRGGLLLPLSSHSPLNFR